MKRVLFFAASLLITASFVNAGAVDQRIAAEGVIQRLLGAEAASYFVVEMIRPENGLDVFEVESVDGHIVLRGSNGVSACRGLKWYLNNLCHSSISWRGDHLGLPDPLPKVSRKVRETTPFEYRYIFNFCTYGYSMVWWKWPEWEHMLDILALNGINLPLCPLGQEKAWQETYREFGLTHRDLDDFFAGPAWQPWQWMACLNGHGGPLPQSVIEQQATLQKRILSRARALGMKPVLMGFSGHVPRALTKKIPDLKVHGVDWQGFPATHSLDPGDPRFKRIGKTFLVKQRELFGTDHFYAIDPFIEMVPPSPESAYRANIAKLIFEAMDAGDPDGIWVLQTWFCKSPHVSGHPWNVDLTKAFFDAVPDNRMLALELHGESLQWTGWFRQNGWYGKPWVWCAIQNFGDQVDLYGGLPQIVENYQRMQASPDKGNPVGMGIMMEGLCYNPVVFELLFDMMWGDGVSDLDRWKEDYLLKRYGKNSLPLQKAWEILFNTRYTRYGRTGCTPLLREPAFLNDVGPDPDMMRAWRHMLDAAPEFQGHEAFHYDLVNVAREAMGGFASHFASRVKQAYESKDVNAFKKAGAKMLDYIRDFDRLMGTNEHFLLGRWVEGARSWGATPAEKKLLEWGAKRQITDWGGNIGNYSIKEWSGIMVDYILPQWVRFLDRKLADLTGEAPPSRDPWNYDTWVSTPSDLPTQAEGDPVAIAREMWENYGKSLWDRAGGPLLSTPPGIAVAKPVVATQEHSADTPAELAVDGKVRLDSAWWATRPASLTVDLEKPTTLFGFQVYPYWDGTRYYQYTIETSLDGESWSTLIDRSENLDRASPAGHLHNFKMIHPQGVVARYVRLNMLKNSANPGVHVVELKVFDADVDW